MDNQQPSREELIWQIADVLGKAQPKPPRGKQIFSALVSIIIRSACVSYSIYLGILFLQKYSRDTFEGPTRNISNVEVGLAFLFLLYMGYRIFRQVYRDRLVPIKDMLQRLVGRLARIVLTFLFWSWFLSLFGYRGVGSFWSLLGFMFIVSSGYDFPLAPRPRSQSSQS